MNHALLPKVKDAQLPEKYSAAKLAIMEANRVDECKDWADKAAALASYARQSGDDSMEKMALKIRARAIQRCGQLLGEIEKGHGPGRGKTKADNGQSFSRGVAAKDAGMSERQAKEALRVANVPEAKFEAMVESENPPTITKLAEMGTKKREVVPHYVQRGISKEAFQAGMYYAGALRSMAEQTRRFKPQDVVDGSNDYEREAMRRHIEEINTYNEEILFKL